VLARSLADEYPWLEFLPEDARQQFTEEFFRVLRASATVDRFAAFDQMIEAWKSTAEIYADPELLARLQEPGDAAIPAPSPLEELPGRTDR
jgi:Rad3-related DNA helicase